MSTDQPTGHHYTPADPITARMSAGEWAKVLGLIISTAIGCAAYIISLQGSVTDATREAQQAQRDATKALDKSNEVKAELQGALVNLSSKLGRIEGLLEQLTREGQHK
jgi:uncharacterized protein HemX